MALPPISSPKRLWQDLREFYQSRQRHQLVFAALSVAITVSLGVQFYFQPEARVPYKPPPVIYVKQWPGNRSDAIIRAQQMLDAPAERKARAELKAAQAEQKRQAEALKKALGL